MKEIRFGMPVYYARHALISALLFLCCSNVLWAQQAEKANQIHKDASAFNIHTDFLYPDNKTLYQDFHIITPKKTEASIQIQCYWYKSMDDSLLVYRKTGEPQALKKGFNTVKLKILGGSKQDYVQASFAQAVKRTEIIPPGFYKSFLTIHYDTVTYHKTLLHEADSSLSLESGLRKGVNRLLAPVHTNFFGMAIKPPASLDKASGAFEHSKYRLARYFKSKGLNPVQYSAAGKEIIDLYFDKWFMGRYEMPSKASVSSEVTKEQNMVNNNMGDMTKSELSNYQSLTSQFRKMKKESQDKDNIEGQIALSTNFSNGQETGSGQDNNYYELTGSIALPLFNIPFDISGYYTSQDKDRQAKASYIHFSYDVNKAKEQLAKLMGSYSKRYDQAMTQGGNYQMVYGQFIQQLQQQKDQEIASLKQQTGVADFNPGTFNSDMLKTQAMAMAQKAENKAKDSLTQLEAQQKNKLQDSLSKDAGQNDAEKELQQKMALEKAEQQKADSIYAKGMDKYKKIMALEAKIEKYETLLEQYKNTTYFDSVMTSSKLGNPQDVQNMSYKDMAKKASSLLPDGQVKTVATGLTNFDVGMFPANVSSYTQSGQMLKGLSAGYDIGFGKIGGSYGNTQYIDADGNVENYKAYSANIQFKPVMHQQFGLVYYGYSPSSNLLSDSSFLKDASVTTPSFKKVTSIISATYTGNIGKYATISSEYAISTQGGQPQQAADSTSFNNRSAYNLKGTVKIPSTTISVDADYEHTGTAFVNNTLPVIMAGTDQIEFGCKGDFFRSFLSLGVDYNYLLQNSFYTQGHNSQWGFSVATHSKRLPSVAFSYKPFSTFQSYTDTGSIPQKPIVGEVWTGKASYQIKKLDKAIRFSLMYTRDVSIEDTINYNSSLIQFSTILSKKTTMFSITIGSSIINTDYIQTADSNFNNNQFIDLAASGNIAKNIILSGGTDIAGNKSGLCRYGLFTGITYTFKKMPIMIRGNFRYSNYRMDAPGGWQPLYFGGIELAWKFKMKMWE